MSIMEPHMKVKEMKTKVNPNPTIHEDLLFAEILIRLPPKILFRFRTVSKQWLSTISSPKFAKLHLQRSNANPCYHGILFKKDENFSALSYTYDGCNENFDIHMLQPKLDSLFFPRGPVSIAGSCNGLVCFWLGSEVHTIYVYNPATRERREILPSIQPSSFNPNYGLCVFSYIPSLGDYKLVTIECGGGSMCNTTFRVHALTLKSSEWNTYESIFPGLKYWFSINLNHYRSFGIVLSNMMNVISHWLILRLKEGGAWDFCILGFNMVTETFHEVPMHQCIIKKCNSSSRLSTIKDNLCIAFPSDRIDEFLEVWELERYEDWRSWKNILKVRFTNILDCPTFVHHFTAYRSSKGVKVLLHMMNGRVWHVYKSDQRFECVRITDLCFYHSSYYCDCAVSYVESLVSPFMMESLEDI